MVVMTAFHSFRMRIVVWFIIVLTVTLATLGLTTRTILMSGISDDANADVHQEIEEFRTFATEGTDPDTARPFDSGQRLVEVFLARQIPGGDEAIVGVINDQILQITHPPRPLDLSDAVVREALHSGDSAGVVEDPQVGAIHWARTEIAGDDASLLVARFTDTDRTELTSHLQVFFSVGLGALLLGAGLAWFVAGRLLAPVRQVRDAAVGLDGHTPGQRIPVPATDDDTADLARTVNTLLDRIDHAEAAHRGVLASLRHHLPAPTRDVLEELRPGVRGTPPAVPISQLIVEVERAVDAPLHPTGELRGSVHADGSQVGVALDEAARFLSDRSGSPVLGAQLVSDPDQALVLWAHDGDVTLDEKELAELFDPSDSAAVPPGPTVLHAVADAHGGRAFAESAAGQGTVLGLALPLLEGEPG